MESPIGVMAVTALGVVYQWVLFGPKKIPMWVAWGGLVVSAVALWFWSTPNAVAQWQVSWRDTIAGIVLFVLAAKGAGSTAKSAKVAPATNSI